MQSLTLRPECRVLLLLVQMTKRRLAGLTEFEYLWEVGTQVDLSSWRLWKFEITHFFTFSPRTCQPWIYYSDGYSICTVVQRWGKVQHYYRHLAATCSFNRFQHAFKHSKSTKIHSDEIQDGPLRNNLSMVETLGLSERSLLTRTYQRQNLMSLLPHLSRLQR